MKKYFISLALTAVMALSLAACGGDAQSTDTDADTSGDESASGSQTYTVGIIQQVQHEALDAATQGFQDALTELLGDSVTIDPQNASGDTANCTTIANNFVSQGVDLIMANGTTALQAAATGTSTIPILGTSITEYGVALGIDGFTGTTGYNVSGTSDLAPLDQQAEMLHTWFPDAQTVACCTAPPSPTASIRWTPSKATWRIWAIPAPNTPSPTPTTCPLWPPQPARPAMSCTFPPTTPPPTTPN